MNSNTNGLDQREGFKHRQESTGSPGLSGYWTCFKLLLLRRPPCQQFVRRDNSNRRGKERTENKKETCRHSLVLLFVSSRKEAGHRETTPCSLLDPPPSLSPCPPSLTCPTSTYIHTYIHLSHGWTDVVAISRGRYPDGHVPLTKHAPKPGRSHGGEVG